MTRFAALVVTISLLVAAYSNFLMVKETELALLFAGFTLYDGGRYSADAIIFRSRSR